ncbi:tubulin polyglutamylase complex subunit 2 [Frankliniella occidentalis]|uniref:Tubulin polyglutamylase complex subunit 2 n=1 Tax=Frankliniella occidentalis TaxID=133901 RepID=A0A6J1T5M6_FRAOC|nr:tubulin polyglutamylase complex subunit 2 [Frankliniella occidentalis]
MVDITCQDAFYENLTLGLVKLLTQTPGVQDVRLDKRTPCERLLLSSWEQRHCCALPDDLRQFYLSSDGFSLTWNYQNAGQLIPLGHMRVNAITELRRLAGVKSLVDADSPTLLDVEICRQAAASGAGQAPGPSCTERPNFGVKCKIFELDPCQGMAKVCLVYLDKGLEPRRPEPRIWLLDRCFEWHFLASDFTTYFRMMLVHQGLPLWQFRGTPMGLTPWAEQMLTLIAPHLLLNQPDSSAHALHTMEWADAPYSHLDPTIFKTRSKVKKK